MSRPNDIPQDVWEMAALEATKFVEWVDPPSVDGGADPGHVLAVSFSRAIMAERERYAKLIDEGFDREVGNAWFPDGRPSKHDKCKHDKWMYEDCEACAAAAIRKGTP